MSMPSIYLLTRFLHAPFWPSVGQASACQSEPSSDSSFSSLRRPICPVRRHTYFSAVSALVLSLVLSRPVLRDSATPYQSRSRGSPVLLRHELSALYALPRVDLVRYPVLDLLPRVAQILKRQFLEHLLLQRLRC